MSRSTPTALGDRPGDQLAAPGDVVVIAGKGHEQGRGRGAKLPFDDGVVAREALRA